ncbi:MAG: hypothetical protein LUG24_09825 [Clostridiales bacterium]|nr:hypothetical protein [Clostridiales bacterium]
MKRIISFFMAFILVFSLSGCANAEENTSIDEISEVTADSYSNSENIAELELVLQIDSSVMTVNGEETEIDSAPIITEGRTLVPIRAIIEAIGGSINWNSDTQTAELTYNSNTIGLTIDSSTAYFNETPSELDVAPKVVNERIMLPIRFIAENFEFDVEWDSENQYIIITKDSKNTAETDEIASADTVEAAESNSDSKETGNILIAYFSRADENYNVGVIEKGNTEIIAELIAEETGGYLFKIERTTPYPENYDECTEEAQREKQENARPELVSPIESIEDYDIIYLGYPIWWGDMPMAVYTFMESYDFTGKTIVPFCTNEGSGISSTVSSISEKCPGADVTEGFAIRGTTAQNSQDEARAAVIQWLEELNLN